MLDLAQDIHRTVLGVRGMCTFQVCQGMKSTKQSILTREKEGLVYIAGLPGPEECAFVLLWQCMIEAASNARHTQHRGPLCSTNDSVMLFTTHPDRQVDNDGRIH